MTRTPEANEVPLRAGVGPTGLGESRPSLSRDDSTCALPQLPIV